MTLTRVAGCDLGAVRDMEEALDLWAEAFPVGRGSFEEFLQSDPWRRAGDTLGAFDSGELVSTVSLARRELRWQGGTIWCAGIAAVATRERWRRRGLSRALLAMMLEKLQQERFAFSMLYTDVTGHYLPLGWRIVLTPQPVVTLEERLPDAPEPEEMTGEWDGLFRLREHFPAPLLALERGEFHFHACSTRRWKNMRAHVLRLADAGYLVARPLENKDRLAVTEIVAMDERSEEALVVGAGKLARRLGCAELEFEGLPPFGQGELVRRLGRVRDEVNARKMFRNVSLSEEDYRGIVELYHDGRAVWWLTDSF